MVMPRNREQLTARFAALIGAPFYVVCGISHVCMDGHMAHPPYAALHYINDLIWIASYGSVAVLGLLKDLPRRGSLLGFSAFLLLSRLAMGSGGGMLFIFELPVLLLLIRSTRLPKGQSVEPNNESNNRRRTIRQVSGAIGFIFAIPILILLGWLASRVFFYGKGIMSQKINISKMELPFATDMVFRNRQAVRLILPNGKHVALWCAKPGLSALLGGQELELKWGERPFAEPKGLWIKQEDGTEESNGWDSYIRFGGVSPGSGSGRFIEMFVDEYRVTVREKQVRRDSLPVTLRVRLATATELSDKKEPAVETGTTTPLHEAASDGREDVVRSLVSSGADALARDEQGATALHLAASNGHIGIVQFFLDHRVPVDVKAGSNRTPLLYACAGGRTEVVRLLLDKGADIKVSTDCGWTPLHFAANAEVVELLIDGGAEMNVLDSWDETELTHAIHNKQHDVVEALRKHGARE